MLLDWDRGICWQVLSTYMASALILGRALTVMKVAIVVMLRNIKKIDFFMPMSCESLKLPAHRVLFDLNTVD
jgi:hypothetical protein